MKGSPSWRHLPVAKMGLKEERTCSPPNEAPASVRRACPPPQAGVVARSRDTRVARKRPDIAPTQMGEPSRPRREGDCDRTGRVYSHPISISLTPCTCRILQLYKVQQFRCYRSGPRRLLGEYGGIEA
eukprot:COSAG01_NODE_43171_length_432_cov_1.756757_1_plen_127_part_01